MISVITPNFNGEAYLHDYFESIAQQTLPQDEIEVLFVDDGSTDNSRTVVDSYKELIPGLKPIWAEHTGSPGELRNVALQNALGHYVLFLDSDDYLGKRSLEKLHDFATTTESDIVAFQLEGVNRSVPSSMLRETIIDADVVDSGLYKSLGVWKLVKNDFLRQNSLQFDASIHRGEDVLFFLEAMLRSNRTSVTAGYPFYYLRGREDGSSITQESWDPRSHLQVTERAIDLITELAPDEKSHDHFMIRPFNRDALEIAAAHNASDAIIDRLITKLSPHWTRSVARLIYTEENRQKLSSIFGAPHD